MAKILVQITHGPEDPTRAALGFLIAKTALEEGHTVTVFLAGDAVQLLRPAVIENLAGLGTGKLSELLPAVIAGGARIYASGLSSKSRGVSEEDLAEILRGQAGGPIEFAMPNVLVRLALDHDRMFTY